jgi:hypothetical protein
MESDKSPSRSPYRLGQACQPILACLFIDDASTTRSLALPIATCETGFPVGLGVTAVIPRFISVMVSHASGGMAFSRSPPGVGVTPTRTQSYL